MLMVAGQPRLLRQGSCVIAVVALDIQGGGRMVSVVQRRRFGGEH